MVEGGRTEDERGNVERRALFVGLWPPMLWLMGDTISRQGARGSRRRGASRVKAGGLAASDWARWLLRGLADRRPLWKRAKHHCPGRAR